MKTSIIKDIVNAYDDMEALQRVLRFAKGNDLPCWDEWCELFMEYAKDDDYEDHGEEWLEDCFTAWVDAVSGDMDDFFPEITEEVMIALGLAEVP